jgi:hypothetical protein
MDYLVAGFRSVFGAPSVPPPSQPTNIQGEATGCDSDSGSEEASSKGSTLDFYAIAESWFKSEDRPAPTAQDHYELGKKQLQHKNYEEAFNGFMKAYEGKHVFDETDKTLLKALRKELFKGSSMINQYEARAIGVSKLIANIYNDSNTMFKLYKYYDQRYKSDLDRRDQEDANKWLEKAANNGHEDAIKIIETRKQQSQSIKNRR